jgi:predicted RNA-binding Zn-ribbon protein involved in translation (DUF1610 family)
MSIEDCPDCGEHIGAPSGSHAYGLDQEAAHSNRECPKCGRPLIWFSDEDLAPGWRIDETKERRQRLADGD